MENNTMAKGDIFVGLDVSDVEKFRVGTQIAEVGGLTFSKINKSPEGWFSQCNEIEGIIAGNKNPNPTPAEIESEIREAILSAFNVKVKKEESQNESPYSFKFKHEKVLA